MTKLEWYEGQAIEIRDGYMDGTALGQANGKDISDWLGNRRTTELFDEIESDTGIPVSDLVRKGKQHGHTFLHPLCWPSFAQWCKRKCELWVNKLLVTRYMNEFTHAAYGEQLSVVEEDEISVHEEDEDNNVTHEMLYAQNELTAIRMGEDRLHDRPAAFRLEQRVMAIEERLMRIGGSIGRVEREIKAQRNLLEAISAVADKTHQLAEQLAQDMYQNVWKGIQWLVTAMHRVRPTRHRPNKPTQQKALDEMEVDRLLKNLRDQDEMRG